MNFFAWQRSSVIPQRVFAVFLFLYGICFAHEAVKATTTIGLPVTIDMPQTWTLDESPYVISGEGFLDVQSELTIEPGVRVIFSPNQSMFIRGGGSLSALGTPDAPILFTGSGSACTPAERWGGLFVDTQFTFSHIRHTEFHCGSVFTGDLGHYEIDWNHPADFDSFYVVWIPSLVTGEAFIDVRDGEIAIDNTSFYDLTSSAVSNASEYTIQAKDNWWGHGSGPLVSTNPSGIGYGITGDILYDPWIGKEEIVPSSTTKNPVIFIPGIMGTEFVKRVEGREDELVWFDPDKTILSFSDNFFVQLSLNNLGNSTDSSITSTDVIRSKFILGNTISVFDYTDTFTKNLMNERYEENKNLFLFPYDWRMSSRQTSQLLANRIEEIRKITGAERVDIIAHSMGGLVAKDYLRQHNSDHRIGKLIFLGTPHLGAPDAAKNLLFGGDLGIAFREHSFLNHDRVKELSLNMPSIYELLPSRKYIETYGAVVSDARKNSKYTYDQTREFFRISHFNDGLFSSAEAFHQNIDDLSFPSDIDVYSIEGCGIVTPYGVVRRSKKFGADEWNLRVGSGDGTVPIGSASSVAIPASHHVALRNVQHSTMPSDASVNRVVGEILTGTGVPSLRDSISNNCGLKGKLVSVHSPVEISATDSLGNRVGKVGNGDIEVGIPGALYEELDENKFIFIPESEESTSAAYTVFFDGTATGTFNVRVTTVDSAGTEITNGETNLFLDVPVNTQSVGSIPITFSSLQTSSEPILFYDMLGNGQVRELMPDATTSGLDDEDLVAPRTVAHVIGAEEKNGWYRSSVTTTLVAVDEGSEVLRTMYSLDAGQTWITYVQPIIFDVDGRYSVQYFSIDTLGNREEIKTLLVFIDKTPPEAQFFFNSRLQDVSVIGFDNMSSTTVSTAPNSYTVKDDAGNTLQLVFDEINRPVLKRASLNRLVYNGRVVMPNARLTSFVWLTNARNEMSSLQQALRYGIDEGLYALYTKLGGRTFIRERANWNAFQDRYESGMKIFNFRTNHGNIIYN